MEQFSSPLFEMGNGVKQGGVLSPFLFGLYLDPLLIKIRNSGLGCHVGSMHCNVYAYADDVVILAPSISALKSIIIICESFAVESKLEFNCNKSEVVIFSKNEYIRNSKPRILLSNKILTVSKSYKHLGVTVSNKSDIVDYNEIINEIKIKCNVIKSEFYNQNHQVKVKLFNSQCMSLYGCPLWDLDSADFRRLEVTWRKCCRSLLSLPWRTHNVLIPEIMNSKPIDCIVHNRFINFMRKGLVSENCLVNFMFKNSLTCPLSMIKRKLNTVLSKYDLAYLDLFEFTGKKYDLVYNCQVEQWKLGLLKEVLNFRDKLSLSFLNRNEIYNLINFICTS